MKSCSRSLFTDGDGEREGERGLELQESLLTIKKEPDGERDRKETQKEGEKVEVCRGWGSVSRCVRLQVASRSEYVDGKGGRGGEEAGREERSRLSLVRSSYVGINHDSEMTYFLTPQTNSTFNRSQGRCQTAFFPLQSLRKLHLGGLDYRDIMQEISISSAVICSSSRAPASQRFIYNM